MNDNTSGRRGRQRRAGLRRAGVVAAAAAGTAVLIAACGAGGSSTAGTSKTGQKALAFAQCMRSHGEPNFPDPSSDGTISTSQIDINAPPYHAALNACGQLQAGVQVQLSAVQQQELIKRYLKVAACMRAHGITTFPDPNVQDAKAGYVSFSMPSQATKSPLFPSAWKACESS